MDRIYSVGMHGEQHAPDSSTSTYLLSGTNYQCGSTNPLSGVISKCISGVVQSLTNPVNLSVIVTRLFPSYFLWKEHSSAPVEVNAICMQCVCCRLPQENNAKANSRHAFQVIEAIHLPSPDERWYGDKTVDYVGRYPLDSIRFSYT